jgi:hypothetical protein
LSDNDLLVIVPTRGRRVQCERLLESFTQTATCADLLFVLDPDDLDTYADMDWGEAVCAALDPRAYLTGKLNQTALPMAEAYRVLMWAGDDHVFRPPPEEGGPAWDRAMLDLLDGEMGGSGWVYPDDRRRHDVPEIWMCSSDIVRELGWFANPAVQHYYNDNSIAELGKRSGLIRYCPQAVVEHLHYSVAPQVEHDVVYQTTEQKFGAADLQAFQQWRADQMPYEVAPLRRRFSKDVAWVLGKVA